jgi:uncharacterized protein DUF4232
VPPASCARAATLAPNKTMTNAVRLALLVITISLAFAPVYSSRTSNSPGRLAAVVPSCAHQNLKVKAGEGNAAMGGVRETPFIFTNVSASACTLEGYPNLELLNEKGALVKRANKQKSDEPPAAVTIEPGKTAWFNLNYNAGGAGHMGKPCPAYSKVKITAPGVTQPFVLRAEIQTCSRTDFSITAITSGEPQ